MKKHIAIFFINFIILGNIIAENIHYKTKNSNIKTLENSQKQGEQNKKRRAKILSIKKFAGKADSYTNTTPAIIKAIEKAKKISGNIIIDFPKGRYDFYPQHCLQKNYFISNHSDINPHNIAIPILGIKNLIIEGNGSKFIFHGRMLPFTIDESQNITIRNLSIDWERPTISQGEIIEINKNDYLLRFPAWCKYEIRNNHLYMIGEGWGSTCKGIQPFDAKTGRIKYRSTAGLGIKSIDKIPAKEVSKGIVRLQNHLSDNYKVGDIIVTRHNDRDNPGFFIRKSKNTLIENVDLHYCCAMGVLGQRSENITLRKFRIIATPNSGRRFTSYCDGTHFSGCKGLILVENCLFEYMLDDAINVHGTCLRIIKINKNSVIARFVHKQSRNMEIAQAGDSIQFINRATMLPYGSRIVKNTKLLKKGKCQITFTQEIPKNVIVKDAIENITWTPEVIFRKNIVRNNRARGMLFNSPRKTIVENNIISSAGSAILVAGDSNYWFESGAVGTFGPIIIRNNKFNNCLTNLYQFTKAIISIDPVIPKAKKENRCYHQNIIIENNTFRMFDYPALFATSVDGLIFRNNTLIRTTDFKPFHSNKHTIKLNTCRNVLIEANKIDKNLLGKDILYQNMDKTQIHNKDIDKLKLNP